MKIIIELIAYCALFTGMVKLAVGDNALNGLYFYPKAVRDKAYELGIAEPKTVAGKRIRFMVPFVLAMFMALLAIIVFFNDTHDFRHAYLEALLFLEVMNWYDGIVIDRLWVGHSPFWMIKGCEGLPYVRTWRQVLAKRGMLTLAWIVGAALVAGVVAAL